MRCLKIGTCVFNTGLTYLLLLTILNSGRIIALIMPEFMLVWVRGFEADRLRPCHNDDAGLNPA